MERTSPCRVTVRKYSLGGYEKIDASRRNKAERS